MSGVLPRTVTTLDLPALYPYRTLRRSEHHKSQGIFVAEGEKSVRRLLQSGLQVDSLLLTPEWYEELVRQGLPRGADVYCAPKALLESITGFRMHQGVMAVGRVPLERSPEDVLREMTDPRLVVALDGVEQVENVGMIVRNCAAFGVQALIVGPTSCSPWLRRAVRCSMGTVFRVPVVHVSGLGTVLLLLRDRYHLPLVVTSPKAPSTITECDLSRGACIVVGNEGAGVSEEVDRLATHRMSIPMNTGVDSLNVGSATAVVLYEARRQQAAKARDDV